MLPQPPHNLRSLKKVKGRGKPTGFPPALCLFT